jgi:nicotinate-nucleotide pyrophosphorylase (carboxylating)
MYLIDSPFGLPPLVVIKDRLNTFLLEDIGPGDLATESLVAEDALCEAVVVAKEDGVLAGLPFFVETFRLIDDKVALLEHLKEGSELSPGSEVVRIKAQAKALLSAERVALNILQRLSGVATATKRMRKAMGDNHALLVDTRKTTPGLRIFEKYAVRVGGGTNHRMGLYDCAMLKENHIRAAGGIKAAVEGVRRVIPFTCKIEVETTNLAEVEEALEAGADVVMLDNFSLEDMRRAITMAKGKAILEASGNITESNIAQVASTGVDVISTGATIHHAVWLDMSMLIAQG